MKRILILNIITAQITAVIAFIFVPLFMISETPREFALLDFRTFIYAGGLLAIIFGSLLGLALALLNYIKLPQLSNSIALFILSWIIVSGFIFPVCSNTQMADPAVIPTNRITFGIVLIISIILSALANTNLKHYAFGFLALVLLSAIISCGLSVFNDTNRPPELGDHFTLSKNKNILVVSFDGLQGSTVSDIIRSDDALAKTFKDFILFENAISQSPATSASIIGELYGVQNYKSFGNSLLEVEEALRNGLNRHLLASFVKDSYVYGNYPDITAKRMTLDPPFSDDYSRKEATIDLFGYSMVRLATNRSVIFGNYDRCLEVLKEFLISAKPGSSLATKLHNHYGPKWDKSFILDINKYDYWVENLDVGNKVFSLRYLHFNFTHFPVDFDTHCIYRSDVKIWHDKHQNEDGMRSEATCALTKFSKLLQKMKLMGIYDQTLVVFKSDHGQPTNYYSNFPNNLLINGGTPWGYSRYRPTLMLKDFGAQNTTISYNEDLVLLNDLAKTLCVSSSLNIDCDPLHGQNILNRENKDKDQSYYIYVPENSKSDFNFENHVSIMIPTRKMDFLKALEVAPLVSLSFSANSADSGR